MVVVVVQPISDVLHGMAKIYEARLFDLHFDSHSDSYLDHDRLRACRGSWTEDLGLKPRIVHCLKDSILQIRCMGYSIK